MIIQRKLLATIAASVTIGALSPSLATARDDGPSFTDMSHPAQVKAAVAVLNGYLVPLSPQVAVTQCELLIEAHPGTVESIYAGVCHLQSGARVMVCGDTGIGEFGLTSWRGSADAATRELLLRFTRANCPGG